MYAVCLAMLLLKSDNLKIEYTGLLLVFCRNTEKDLPDPIVFHRLFPVYKTAQCQEDMGKH